MMGDNSIEILNQKLDDPIERKKIFQDEAIFQELIDRLTFDESGLVELHDSMIGVHSEIQRRYGVRLDDADTLYFSPLDYDHEKIRLEWSAGFELDQERIRYARTANRQLFETQRLIMGALGRIRHHKERMQEILSIIRQQKNPVQKTDKEEGKKEGEKTDA